VLGAVAHTCNPNYSGGGEQVGHYSRPAWANSCQDPISISKPGVVMHVCKPSYEGSHRQEGLCPRLALGKNKTPYLKNN
jgi:hypothetical protein